MTGEWGGPSEVGPAALTLTTGRSERPAAERLGALFDAHHRRLYGLARRLCHTADDARDLVQETFLRAARARSVPDGTPNEEAWLVRVLVNLCRDRWRRTADRRRLGQQYVPFGTAPPSDPETAFVAHSTVWRALAALSPRRRAVIVMYELEGTETAEIARLLGITAVTVRWHLSRGRRELADIIRGDE